MKTMKIAAIISCALGALLCFASMYQWQSHDKPPISLLEALAAAEGRLANESNEYFCVQAILAADKSSSSTSAVWNMQFLSTAGPKAWVSVMPDGNVSLDYGDKN